MDISIIYPLIVPSSYFDKNVWNLPHEPFPNNNYLLTWVFFRGERSMSYIRQDEYSLLNKDHPNWQQKAFENLRHSGQFFYSSYRTDVDTGALSFIIFSNEDGIGSSRILLSYELDKGFSEGYRIAMPDRAFGIAISKSISATEQRELESIINKCYGCTGTAMSKEVMEPSEFLLPNSWTQPVDKEISDLMIQAIRYHKEK